MITKAIIYRQQDYKESSKILYVYTPYGKYSLVARGVKNFKNTYFHLADVYNLIEIKLKIDQSMQTLSQAKLLNDYQQLKKDYNSLKNMSFMLKLINDLVTDDIKINERLFNLLLELFNYSDLNLAYLTLLIKLTYVLGIELSFTNGEGFSLKDGKTVELNKGDLKKVETLYLKLIYYTKEEIEIDPKTKEQLFKFIKQYYLYHLDYKIQ